MIETKSRFADYRERNREAVRAKDLARYGREAEHRRTYAAEQRAADPEGIKASKRAYVEANSDKVREQVNSWHARNRHKAAEYSAQRKAAMLRATPTWADREEIETIYVAGYLTGQQVDHIIPLISSIVCGLHCPANLQLLPKGENASKGNRVWPDMPMGG